MLATTTPISDNCINNNDDKYDDEHICNDKAYHPNLAKKQLVDPKRSEKLSEESATLCLCMQGVAAVHELFGLKPPLKEDESLQEEMGFCRSTFSKAARAVMIMGGVLIAETMSGKAGADEAKALLSKKRAKLPPPLVKKLDAMVEKESSKIPKKG